MSRNSSTKKDKKGNSGQRGGPSDESAEEEYQGTELVALVNRGDNSEGARHRGNDSDSEDSYQHCERVVNDTTDAVPGDASRGGRAEPHNIQGNNAVGTLGRRSSQSDEHEEETYEFVDSGAKKADYALMEINDGASENLKHMEDADPDDNDVVNVQNYKRYYQEPTADRARYNKCLAACSAGFGIFSLVLIAVAAGVLIDLHLKFTKNQHKLQESRRRLNDTWTETVTQLHQNALDLESRVETVRNGTVEMIRHSERNRRIINNCVDECTYTEPCTTAELSSSNDVQFKLCHRGYIQTDGYPNPYAHKTDHWWSFINTGYDRLRLTMVDDFELETHNADDRTCKFDYLWLTGNIRLCGTIRANTTYNYTISDNFAVTMRFKSDESGTRKGFKIGFEFVSD